MMLSSAGQAGDAARCRELGVASYLTKPIRQSQLLDAIMTALHRSDVRSEWEGIGQRSGVGSERPAVATGPSVQTPPLRILLAEDNEVNQKLAVRILEKRGHSVVVTNNGREALEALETQRFQVALMDVQMPEMGGFEATAAIREKEKQTRTHLPIVAMTAHAMKGDRERCLAAGMDGYVTKPIDPQHLFDAIAAVVTSDELHVTSDEVSKPGGGSSASSPLVTRHSSLDEEVLDKAAVLKRVSGDLQLLKELVEIFLEDCPQHLATLREAIDNRNNEALERAAHKMKGSVSNFGARAAVESALHLETMGREGDLSQAEAAYADLEAGLERLKPALVALVDGGV
jgi:CheY-like chemotaxis protein